MMNSTIDGDDFDANPFRSGDPFYDSSDPFSQQQQQQQQQTHEQFQQQSFQPQPMQGQQFQPQMQGQQLSPPPPMMNTGGFPSPSGPMDNMMGPAGLMVSHQHQQQMPPQQHQQRQPPQLTTSWWGNCMLCINMDSYKAYFDIDADDIINRIRSVFLTFYKPEHFRNNVLGAYKTDSLKGPDLYGPFWVTMTLIFFIGVSANLHDYAHSTDVEEFDYDINHLLHAASICCGYAFVVPTILWVTTQCCMSMNALQLVEWVCLYGYSLCPYLPAVIVSIIPFGIVSWVTLSAATVASCLLVVRNVAHPLLSSDAGQAKAPPIILAILGSSVIFLLFLKFTFYHYTETPST